jgi:hypothetical protein
VKSLFYLCIALVIPVLSGCGASDHAGKINILIMGEDADSDTVPRNSTVFKRVLNGLSNELHNKGFSVYDETAVTMDHSTQGRTRRVDQEIIDVARSVKRPPIDVAVIFAIYTDTDKTAYTQKIYARIEGRLLNVLTGQRLGSFEVELPGPVNARLDCERECILEKVGQNARALAQDLGAVLTSKLAHRVRGNAVVSPPLTKTAPTASSTPLTTPLSLTNKGLPTAYALVFNGFDSSEIIRIENNIVGFNGYSHHRPITSSLRQIEYWYETGSSSAELNRNLRDLLELLEVKGRLTFSGRQFLVQKIGLR